MIRQPLRSAFARLGPVSRRDQRIADLTRRAKQLEKERRRLLESPSFHVRLNEENRLRKLEVEVGAPSRSVIAGGKFRVYDLVRSHDIEIPEQYGRWDNPADIPWDQLPDAVVIKSAFGAASRGVIPLRRVDDGWRIATHDTTLTGEQISADLAELTAQGKVRPPFGAEEFLDDGTGAPPVDVKVYAFYGDTPIALLRRVDKHGPAGESMRRFIDVSGADVLDYAGKPTDPNIALPEAMSEVFAVASRISVAIRTPFTRIDLYDIHGRVVFGELTPRPGMGGRFGPKLDSALGAAWERAQVRLWRDIADGMSPEPEWGPAGHTTGG